MKITLLMLTVLASFVPLAHSNEKAIESTRAHLESYLKGEFKGLDNTYAEKVILMPGHELLKEEYGLSGPNGRTKALTVDRAKLIERMAKANGGRPNRPEEKVNDLLKILAFKTLETKEGDFPIDPSDPVATPDGKLHFEIKAEDVLIKVSPPKGDFLLFQLRLIEGKWRIVAEYLD